MIILRWVYTRDFSCDLVVTISFVLGVAATNRVELVQTDSKRQVARDFFTRFKRLLRQISIVYTCDICCDNLLRLSRHDQIA